MTNLPIDDGRGKAEPDLIGKAESDNFTAPVANENSENCDTDKKAAETAMTEPHDIESAGEESAKAGRKGKHGKHRTRNLLIIILAVILSLAVAATGTLYVLIRIGRGHLTGNNSALVVPERLSEWISEDGKNIIHDGINYKFNENAVSILVMGVDRENLDADFGYGNNGQADYILLLSLDTVTGEIKALPISRESMAPVNVYSTDGHYIDTETMQLCLAYAYGDIPQASCENVEASVSKLLYGLDISAYVTVDMKGISAITDIVGKITVTCNEDIYSLRGKLRYSKDKSYTLGGNELLTYLRARTQEIDANSNRMERHKEVLRKLASAAGNKVVNNVFSLPSMYSAVAPYTVTDLELSDMTYLASCCLTANVGSVIEFVSITGESAIVDEHVQFTPDEQSVLDAMLEMFYTAG